jgi:hypothetical protein
MAFLYQGPEYEISVIVPRYGSILLICIDIYDTELGMGLDSKNLILLKYVLLFIRSRGLDKCVVDLPKENFSNTNLEMLHDLSVKCLRKEYCVFLKAECCLRAKLGEDEELDSIVPLPYLRPLKLLYELADHAKMVDPLVLCNVLSSKEISGPVRSRARVVFWCNT